MKKLFKICFLIILFTQNAFGQSQMTNCKIEVPPPNKSDGSGEEFYPYKGENITVFGYPASETQKHATFIFNLPEERKWKDNFRYRQDYYIYYKGSNFGTSLNLNIDDQIENEDG